MASTQLRLLLSRRLGWYLIAEFLGVVNDNLFKSALIISLAYHQGASIKSTQLVVTLVPLIYLLPCFLLSAIAGQLADKYEKTRLIQAIKVYEVGAMVLATAALASGDIAFEIVVLFMLGSHSYFFAPVKYGILPSLLGAEDLMAGNALVEANTFVGSLLGTVGGSLLILVHQGRMLTSGTLVLLAAIGLAASFFIPRVGRADPGLRINPNLASETWRILRYLRSHPVLRAGALGISWFYFFASVFVGQLPNYAKATLAADNQVVTLFLTIFSIGVGVGALLCGQLSRARISVRTVPFGAVAMSVFAIDLYLASPPAAATNAALTGIAAFVAMPANWRIIVDLLGLAVSAGFFALPLYVLLQAHAERGHRARVTAANNLQNAVFIIASGLACAGLLALGAAIPQLFLIVALANGAVAVVAIKLARGHAAEGAPGVAPGEMTG